MTNSSLAFPVQLGCAIDGDGKGGPVMAHSVVELLMAGPLLPPALRAIYGLALEDAEAAAAMVNGALHAAWSSTSYGEDYGTWLNGLPEQVVSCLLDMAANACWDSFAVAQHLRIIRIVFAELATGIANL